MASGAGDRVSSSWSKFESLAVFGVATVDFGLGFTPYKVPNSRKMKLEDVHLAVHRYDMWVKY